MPIHDQSYRHYLGGKALPGRAWMVIARAGIANMIGRRAFLALLLASWLPFVGAVIAIYFTTNVPQAALFAPTAQRFREFLSVQEQFAFFITIYAGAGLIANDRRANALQIYLSKPLMRTEYIAGKAAVLFAFLLLVTLIPSILLLLVQATFAGSFQFIRANLFLIPAITVASLLFVLLSTSTMLALSSLSKSSRYVAILYTGVVMFTWIIFNILYAITGTTSMSWMSPTTSLAQVVDVIFRLKPRVATPWQVSLLVVVGLIVLSISVLERRVRGVEVVT